MATTVIQVQEVEKEIEISYLAIELNSNQKYKAKDENRDVFYFETTQRPGCGHYLVFENGNIRFNRPVKIIDDVK